MRGRRGGGHAHAKQFNRHHRELHRDIRRKIQESVERAFEIPLARASQIPYQSTVGTQYNAWFAIVGRAQWRTPEDVKESYPKASILKGSRVVFSIKGTDYRLIASVQYQAGVLVIRFFGTHAEYEKIDAESV